MASIAEPGGSRQAANVCYTPIERRPGGALTGESEVRLTARCATPQRRWTIPRLAARLLVAAFAALAVSACINVDLGSTFVVDGTASSRMAVVFQRDLLDPAELALISSEIDTAEQRMTDAGYEVQRIDSATQIGLRAARTFSDAANVATELNSLINAMFDRAASGPIAPFQGTFSRSNPAVGGNKYHLELTFDGPAFREAVEGLLPPTRRPASPSQLTEALTVTYSATMPGDLQDSTGQRTGEGTARWILSLDEPTSIVADSSVGQNTPWALAALAILVAVGVIVVSSILITTILVVRRQSIERRLPMALRLSREHAREMGMTVVEPPTQWDEIKAAIGRAVRVALSGQRPTARVEPVEAEREETTNGADTERD